MKSDVGGESVDLVGCGEFLKKKKNS